VVVFDDLDLDRWMICEGVMNLRDLGGYRVASGGQVRRGQVFRSDSLHTLTPRGLVQFRRLGITTVYDLRCSDEREAAPGPVACVHHELPSRRVSDTNPGTLRTRTDGERWLLEDYTGMLANGAAVFGALFGLLAEADDPVLFHCWGGKDRTGMTAALLLSGLGVDREVVLDDYELTAHRKGPEHIPEVVELFVSTGIARDAAVGMLSSPRRVMAQALTLIDTTFGGIDEYLQGRAGLTSETVATLRERLTVTDADQAVRSSSEPDS
jgi:protein-tyrosine phosphatase